MRILLSCLALLLLLACGKDKPSGDEASAARKPSGTVSVQWAFAELAIDDLAIGSAIAYVEPNEVTIELAGKGVAGVACGHSWSDRALEPGQLGLVLRTKGTKYSVPFNRKPGKLAGVGYTVYYRPKGGAKTNSGNSARRDLPTQLTISKLDSDMIEGRFELTLADGEKASGRFAAKVCPR